MSNYGQGEDVLHRCECQSGWHGHACDQCVSDAACQPLFNSSTQGLCDKTAIVVSRKSFSCLATDKQLEQLGIHNLSFALQFDAAGLDSGNGHGTIQCAPHAALPPPPHLPSRVRTHK